MIGYAGVSTPLMVKFPAAKAGLSTVGFTLRNIDGTDNISRSTTGVIDLGNGNYNKAITIANPWVGSVLWDTGEVVPLYASEEISILSNTAVPSVVEIRQELDSNSSKLANLDAAVSTRSTFAGGAVASVTNPVTLISDYDAAKTAASATSVAAIPTNPLLTTDIRLDHLDANISSIPTVLDIDMQLSINHGAGDWEGGGSIDVGAIADAVWNETLTDHITTGSTGAQLQAAGAAGDPWTTLLPGDYAEGTAGATVAALQIPEYTGPVVVIPAPTIAGTQILYGYVIDGNGVAVSGAKITTTVTGTVDHVSESLLLQLPKETTTDAAGFWSIAVVKTIEYAVIVENSQKKTITITSANQRALTAYFA